MAPTRLCTVEYVKHQGNINVAYEYDDPGLVRAIRAATTAIFSVTRRNWELKEYLDRIPVPRSAVRGSFRLWTSVRPVWLTPVAPKISFSTSFSSIGSAISQGSYDLDPATGRIDFDPYMLRGYEDRGFIRIAYVGGLAPLDSDPDIFDAPEDLVQACAMQAAYTYDRIVNSKVGVKQFAGKTGSTTYTQYKNGLVSEAHALVAPYIRPLTGG